MDTKVLKAKKPVTITKFTCNQIFQINYSGRSFGTGAIKTVLTNINIKSSEKNNSYIKTDRGGVEVCN